MAGNENIWLSLSDLLEKKIRSGVYGGKLPGIRKFAASLGVHPVTLRKALRDLEEKKVVTICDRKGTFVNPLPDRQKYRTIMFINSGSSVAQMPQVQKILAAHGYKHLTLFFEEEQFKDNPGLLRNFPADGFVFTLSSLYAPTVDRLKHAGIPFVSTDGWPEPYEISSVGVDNCLAISTMLQKLKDQGHRRVAFFNSPRAAEYQFFLEQIRHCFEKVFGDDFCPEMFMTDLNFKDFSALGEKQSFQQVARTYLGRCARMPEPPTAFLLIDQWSRTIRDILTETGFDIPGELSIAGSLRFIEPQDLSSAVFDQEEICCAALEQLFKLLKNPNARSICQLVPPRFLPGKTIAPAVKPDLEKWKRLL